MQRRWALLAGEHWTLSLSLNQIHMSIILKHFFKIQKKFLLRLLQKRAPIGCLSGVFWVSSRCQRGRGGGFDDITEVHRAATMGLRGCRVHDITKIQIGAILGLRSRYHENPNRCNFWTPLTISQRSKSKHRERGMLLIHLPREFGDA